MQWKEIYYWNVLVRVLLYECIGEDFTIEMHLKGIYYRNVLERVLQ